MVLQLNLKHEEGLFKGFTGQFHEQMPLLIQDQRTLLSVQRLMERRLEVLDSSETEVRDAWLMNQFDTGDAILYLRNGRVRVIYDVQNLQDIARMKKSDGKGNLPHLEGAPPYLPYGPEWSRDTLNEYGIGRRLSKREAKDHPILLALARRDQYLLNAYVDGMFAEMERKFNSTAETRPRRMGIQLANVIGGVPLVQQWSIGSLNHRWWSEAISRPISENNNCCLVGLQG